MKQKTVSTEKLIFYDPKDADKPFLIFEVSGSERDVDEAAVRIRNQVLRMDGGIWDEMQL